METHASTHSNSTEETFKETTSSNASTQDPSSEKEKSFSERKSFAFSDEQLFNEVNDFLKQKPKELTNGELLHKALKHYIESEEINQSFNQLTPRSVDLFKGDLARLDIAFETIRSIYKAQMNSSSELVQQMEAQLTAKYEQVLNTQEKELEQIRLQNEAYQLEVNKQAESLTQYQAKEVEWERLKKTIETLEETLKKEQQYSTQLEGNLKVSETKQIEAMTKYQTLTEELSALKEACKVTITTDSQYVKNGITSWLDGWKRKNWRTSSGGAVKNKDLWMKLDEAYSKHDVTFVWVKGHNGHPENERCDELARTAALDKNRLTDTGFIQKAK